MTAHRVAATMDQAMTHKQTITADPAGRRVQAQANIQYLRTGGRRSTRRTARTVYAVPGVRPFFA
jgi:hypothetical protein